MLEDRSLDEFAASSTGDGTDADGGETADEEPPDAAGEGTTDAETVGADGGGTASTETADAATDDGETADVEPAVPTATWTTDGSLCDRCGERVSRRWFDDGDLVCGACKEW
ncbi:MAG: DUF7573 domain-containing protein [Halorubrum sp.]